MAISDPMPTAVPAAVQDAIAPGKLWKTGRFDQLELTDDERHRLGLDITTFLGTVAGLSTEEVEHYQDLDYRLTGAGVLKEDDAPRIDRVLDFAYGSGPVHEDLAQFGQVSNHFHESLMEHSGQFSLLHLSPGEADELSQVIFDYAHSPAIKNNNELHQQVLETAQRAAGFGWLKRQDNGTVEHALRYKYGETRIMPASLSKVADMAGTHYQVLPAAPAPAPEASVQPEAAPAAVDHLAAPYQAPGFPVRGFLASEPQYTPAQDGKPAQVTARLGLRGYYKTPSGAAAADTTYVDLTARDRLADEVHGVLKQGDEVTGVGTLELSTRTSPDGESRLHARVVANSLGPDLRSQSAHVSLSRDLDQHVEQKVAAAPAVPAKTSSIRM